MVRKKVSAILNGDVSNTETTENLVPTAMPATVVSEKSTEMVSTFPVLHASHGVINIFMK